MIKHSPKDTLVQFGSPVKSVNDSGLIGGHLVLFGSPAEKDLYGDYFTAETDFDLHPDVRSAVYYQHGFDYHFKSNVLTRAKMGMDDVGIWIEAQLEVHDEYMEALSNLIDEGIMGWSSGTASHLVEYERRGKAWWIRRWPLGLDASITPNPADPRQVNTLRSLQDTWKREYGSAVDQGSSKQLYFSFKNLSGISVVHKATPETPESVSVLAGGSEDAPDVKQHHLVIEVRNNTMPENETTPAQAQQEAAPAALEQQLATLSAQMQDVMEYVASQRSLRSVGYVTDDGGNADPNTRSFGDFLLAVMRNDSVRLSNVYKSHHVQAKATMVEDSGALGGWAVPEDFDSRLLTTRQNMRSFINLIPRVPVSVPSGRWPRLDIFNAPTAGSGDTAEAAGLTSKVRAEGGAYTETNPLLEEVEWRVNDAISGYIKVSKELRADVGQLEGLLMQLISINDLSKQEYFVLRGNGVGQPLGVLNSDAMIAVTAADDGVFGWADVLKMASRLYTVDLSRTCWTYHPGIEEDLGMLEVGTGGAVWVANMAGGPGANLYGYPLFKSQHLPQDDNSGDVILCDWSQYQIWDRGGAYVDFSEHVDFLNGKDTWRFGRRMDGKPLWLDEITLADPQGSFTQSPFVKHDD